MGASKIYKGLSLRKSASLKLLKNKNAQKSLNWGSYSAKLISLLGLLLHAIFTAELVQQNAPGVVVKPERYDLKNHSLTK